jgi:hypothetical protein
VIGRYEFWRRWLIVVAGFVTVFGLSMVAIPPAAERLFSWMFFGTTEYPFGSAASAPLTGDPAAAGDYLRFLTAVLGAVMAGWGVLILFVAAGPLRRREPWAWRGLAVSLVVWFAADTGASLAMGYPENAVLNTAFLAAFAPGLAGTRPSSLRRR